MNVTGVPLLPPVVLELVCVRLCVCFIVSSICRAFYFFSFFYSKKKKM